MDIRKYLAERAKKIDAALTRIVPRAAEHPSKLSQAMRYAVLSGGKRIRPIFAIASSEAVGGKDTDVLSAACALELVHCYSLVHDDLPCMDNDLVRRGKPSCHAKFGEVTALLAGDALLTQAFEVLSSPNGASIDSQKKKLVAIRWISEAIGRRGMVGGQALDMEYQTRQPDLPTVEFINTHKSGALIAVSARIGAYLGGGAPREVEAVHEYGKCAGLLFQLTDDIMDGQGYAKLVGISEARAQAKRLLERSKKALSALGARGRTLSAIAEFIATRKN